MVRKWVRVLSCVSVAQNIQMGQNCSDNFTIVSTETGRFSYLFTFPSKQTGIIWIWGRRQLWICSLSFLYLYIHPPLHSTQSIPFQAPFSAPSSSFSFASIQIMHAHTWAMTENGWLLLLSNLWRCSHLAECFCRSCQTGIKTYYHTCSAVKVKKMSAR